MSGSLASPAVGEDVTPMSQSQCGRYYITTSGYLSRVENGQKDPTETLARACDKAQDTRPHGDHRGRTQRPRPRRLILDRVRGLPQNANHFAVVPGNVSYAMDVCRLAGDDDQAGALAAEVIRNAPDIMAASDRPCAWPKLASLLP